ncbi:hypothetical protein NEF87_005066 [Candidatus Lokiarchaeum ossiferum]|uniref:Uncharacterized protein n=1 Tax=Candidatus Lokiarchaeum ossiferum TaxID=2951803 RepID=A0ABY6I1X2_9ARCH|nr:hypothetical protein NEF87_005066 [Candidatus Lokiarchaeum sp. B-35]
MWGDPLMELFFRNEFRNHAFLEGYGSFSFSDKSTRVRDHLYDIYLSLIFIIESTARQCQIWHKVGFKIYGWLKFAQNWRRLKKILK